MAVDAPAESASKRGPLFWMALLIAGMAVVIALAANDVVDGPLALVLMLLPAGLLYPLMKSGERCEVAKGYSSPALREYNRAILVTALAYVAGMALAVYLERIAQINPSLMWAAAALPAIPLLGMIAVMARYIQRETDEFLRHKAIMSSLGGLGVLLAVASLWGMLEEFDLVPHMAGWWAVPVWAFGMGATHIWMRVRGT